MRRDAAGRPAGEQDRHGAPLSALEWSPDGRLGRAAVRLPDGTWVTIEPGAGAPGPWGASDRLTLDGRPLTRLAAVDWTRVDRIPPLAEPARLPAGAGTALFNLLARLAVEQGVSVLRYDAPYPTEALFLALLESFRYVPADAGDPIAAFGRGELAWTPAPHDVAIERGGVRVQRRSPCYARRPISSPTACARAPRRRSPPSPQTCRPPRSRSPDRHRPTRAQSPPPRKRSRDKPRAGNRR